MYKIYTEIQIFNICKSNKLSNSHKHNYTIFYYYILKFANCLYMKNLIKYLITKLLFTLVSKNNKVAI